MADAGRWLPAWLLLAGWGVAVQAAPLVGVEVVRSYPHDPNAFTQGLVFHRGLLIESTGLYRDSRLRKIELSTGRLLQQMEVPKQLFAEGIALHDGRLFLLSWQEGTALVIEPEQLMQVAIRRYTGEGWGITSNGRELIVSDGTPTLRFMEPLAFGVVRTLEVRDGDQPVPNLNELEWVRGEIWANVWRTERIARIDPGSGQVIAWVDLSPLVPPGTRSDPDAVPNGIAYDAAEDRLFVTGKMWPLLYEVKLKPAP